MAYSKKVVDKFENTLNNPKAFNVGRFDPSEENIGTGMVGAPACGDVMKLQIKCEPSGNTHVIKDVKFKTYGCGSAIASSSELVEMLIGKTLEEAKGSLVDYKKDGLNQGIQFINPNAKAVCGCGESFTI